MAYAWAVRKNKSNIPDEFLLYETWHQFIGFGFDWEMTVILYSLTYLMPLIPFYTPWKL